MVKGVAVGSQDVCEGREIGARHGGAGRGRPSDLGTASGAASRVRAVVKALYQQATHCARFELVLAQILRRHGTRKYPGTVVVQVMPHSLV